MVLRTDVGSLGKIAFKWVTDIILSRLKPRTQARSLLDTSPLRKLLADRIPFDRIDTNLASGVLHSLVLTANDYATSESINFVQMLAGYEGWTRTRRRSMRATITLDHVMASAAIPLFFPPVKVGERYFGDGCLRNTAPVSPAIHLGADRLVIVGVRKAKQENDLTVPAPHSPTIAKILGVMLNAVLMDALEFDIERLSRINSTLARIAPEAREGMVLRPVNFINLQPSEDIGAFAATQFKALPESIRFLLGGLGNMQEASELISYLLFESEYCRYLVDLGYKDTMSRRDELKEFLL
jgi:NTE family protein